MRVKAQPDKKAISNLFVLDLKQSQRKLLA